ncbi:hypothetical protein A9G02_08445 [Cutibacterium avidum]|nr:hypothetical protein A9G02_08445 [Cutibacterium avidum]
MVNGTFVLPIFCQRTCGAVSTRLRSILSVLTHDPLNGVTAPVGLSLAAEGTCPVGEGAGVDCECEHPVKRHIPAMSPPMIRSLFIVLVLLLSMLSYSSALTS